MVDRAGVAPFLLAEPIVDIDAKHDDGLTALQLATGADNLETIKILLKKGASNEGILDIQGVAKRLLNFVSLSVTHF